MFNCNYEKDVKETFNYIDGTNINIYNKNNKFGYKNIDILGCINSNSNSFLFTDNINPNDNNSGIKLFYDLTNNNPFEKNEIIVVDRYYFSNKFIDTCNKKQIRFIARIKSNSNALDKFNNYLTDVNKKYNYDPFNYKCKYINNDIRIISFKSNNNYVHLATNIFNKKKILITSKNIIKKDGMQKFFLNTLKKIHLLIELRLIN